MNRLFTIVILIFAMVLLISPQGFAATPKETVETVVNRVIAKLSEAGFKDQAKNVQISVLLPAHQ
jgi:hypothetical protein